MEEKDRERDKERVQHQVKHFTKLNILLLKPQKVNLLKTFLFLCEKEREIREKREKKGIRASSTK